MTDWRRLTFLALIYVGGLSFGFGLAYSQMARPEVVLDFLQLQDFGLLFVMGGAAVVAGLTFFLASNSGWSPPLSDREFGRRLKSFDRNVLVGGAVFGVGWGISGLCPGATYASIGIGNYPALLAVGGMFAGAYLQGVWRSTTTEQSVPAPETSQQ